MTDSTIQTMTLDPGADTFQRLRAELGVGSFGLNLISIRPRQRLRVHRHERQEEVYLVLEGELTLIVEGTEHVLGKGTLARVAPEQRRQLTNPSGERTVVLAIGGDVEHEHQGRDGRAWASWEEEGPGRPPQEVPSPETCLSSSPGGPSALRRCNSGAARLPFTAG